MTRAVLSIAETAAEAIPIAGPPIKAVIELLSKALKTFDVSCRIFYRLGHYLTRRAKVRDDNRELADRLRRKLVDLDERIISAENADGQIDSQRTPHLERLGQYEAFSCFEKDPH